MMNRAIPPIRTTAAMKIAISSALDRPPELDELVVWTVTGVVLVCGVVVLGVVVVSAGSTEPAPVAPAALALAGSSSAVSASAPTTATAHRERAPRRAISSRPVINAI
jgi:hypothetical protein